MNTLIYKEDRKAYQKKYYKQWIKNKLRTVPDYRARWRMKNLEKVRRNDLLYQREKRRLGLVDKTKESKIYRRKNPEKVRAHWIFNYNLKKGIIKKGRFCELCKTDKKAIIAHHPNYNEPLKVIFACNSCHKKLHKTNNQ